MYLICALNLINLGGGILLLNLAKCLKAAGIDTTQLESPELKAVLSLANLFKDSFSLILREVEGIVYLDGLSLEVLSISGNK